MFFSFLVLGTGLVLAGEPSANEARNLRGQLINNSIPASIDISKVQDSFEQCGNKERNFTAIDHDLIKPWRASWNGKKETEFTRLLSRNSNLSVNAKADQPWRNREGISEFKWRSGKKLTWKKYLDQFFSISDVALTTEASEINQNVTEGKLKVRFDIRGIGVNGERRNDRGFFEVLAVKESGAWKMKELATIKGETLSSNRAPGFTNVTKASGLDKVPVYTRTEAIRRGGYAVAVNDFDGSGHKSIFVGAREGSSLWKNDGKGNFSKVTSAPFLSHNLVKSAVFADFSNSGRQDLLMARFTPEKNESDLVFYKNQGDGKFSEVKGFIQNRLKSNYSMPMAMADFNNDGLLDVYVGFPGARDFTVLEKDDLREKGLLKQGLFLNKGAYAFHDATKESGLDLSFDKYPDSTLFPHSSISVDIDKDGKSDIIVVDDRGNAGPVYKNMGDGKFAEMGEKIGLSLEALGMGVAVADVDHDGGADVAMSYVNFSAAQRMKNMCPRVAEVSLLGSLAGGGVRLFKNTNGKYNEITSVAGLEWAGEGVANAEFLDYNNDGYADLFVSNGLWSGSSREQDISSLFVQAVSIGGKNVNKLRVNPDQVYTQSEYMKFLMSFRGDAYSGKFDKDGPTPSMAGYQRKRLFRNNGDNTFTEVGFLEGVDSIADGYVAARIDVKGNGKTGLLLRNGDPGTEAHTFPVIELFENNTKNKSLSVSLEGDSKSLSSRDAIGAQLTAEVGGKKYYQTLIGNNGAAQSELVAHFGLGKATKVDLLEVRFPSGRIQTYKNIPAGNFHVKESSGVFLGSN